MSLEYFLFCRKRYDSVINNLNSIIEQYKEINCVTNEEDTIDESQLAMFQVYSNLNAFILKRQHIKKLRQICQAKIISLCNHEYIDDEIDISPESSKKITYCSICEHTK